MKSFTTKSSLAGALAAAALFTGLAAAHGQGGAGRITVQVGRPGAKISPMLYGLMTEEINHAYDGGLYAELLQNRAFSDDPRAPAHWALVQEGGGAGTMALDTAHPVPGTALTTCLRLDITSPAQAKAGRRVGVANDGYWGVPIKPNTAYRATFYARGGGGFTGPLTASLEGDEGVVYARAQVARISGQWARCAVTLRTGAMAGAVTGRFVLSGSAPGTVMLAGASLFPPTFHGRPNGNRIDLMDKMAAMRPAFLRMPGGNYLEGNTVAERFDWKKTLGPVQDRPGHQGPWGYRSSDGVGLLEFLEWCEDLHMKPVLAVFAGYALGGEHVAPGPDLAPFVQDALDEVEYVSGGPGTRWGARRAADGHPAPFPLSYVEIGNEDEYDRSGSYDGRFTQFYDALRAKYPRLQLIATSAVTSRRPDMLDDHFYRSAAAMERDAGHYDHYDRSGPKVFVGEWASQEGSPTPDMNAALGDAAWLTGLERNADVVRLESYAPLLVNVNPGARQWGTNLIGYDALRSFGSPSFYAQSLFSGSAGDAVLPVQVTEAAGPPAPPPAPAGRVGVGTWNTEAEFRSIQVTRGAQTLYRSDFSAGTAGWDLRSGQWQAADGVLAGTGGGQGDYALAGDAGWTDYTYRVQARKTGGREGFLIVFHDRGRNDYVQWNIGGWGNTRTALQRTLGGENTEISRSAPVTVETGRWYDIRVEVQGTRIRCFLDGALVSEADDVPPPPVAPVFAAASRDSASGDVILHVVNVSPQSQPLLVDLRGAGRVAPAASAAVLAGAPGDVNTVDDPRRVAPAYSTLAGVGRLFRHDFPAHSVSVLRIRTGRGAE